LNQTHWPGSAGQFDPIKNGASAIVAHLAYCAIGADEREHRIRAKVVPCRVYQELVRGADFDFAAMLRRADFISVEVVRTRFFVAIIIPVRNMLLIGVRGTQFAYDWVINLKIARVRDRLGEHFHAGFMREAERLADELFPRIVGQPVYFAGHSLGGAVAAVMSNWTAVEACYVFGAPRIGNSNQGGWQ